MKVLGLLVAINLFLFLSLPSFAADPTEAGGIGAPSPSTPSTSSASSGGLGLPTPSEQPQTSARTHPPYAGPRRPYARRPSPPAPPLTQTASAYPHPSRAAWPHPTTSAPGRGYDMASHKSNGSPSCYNPHRDTRNEMPPWRKRNFTMVLDDPSFSNNASPVVGYPMMGSNPNFPVPVNGGCFPLWVTNMAQRAAYPVNKIIFGQR